jgi:hypothetical protein
MNFSPVARAVFLEVLWQQVVYFHTRREFAAAIKFATGA